MNYASSPASARGDGSESAVEGVVFCPAGLIELTEAALHAPRSAVAGFSAVGEASGSRTTSEPPGR